MEFVEWDEATNTTQWDYADMMLKKFIIEYDGFIHEIEVLWIKGATWMLIEVNVIHPSKKEPIVTYIEYAVKTSLDRFSVDFEVGHNHFIVYIYPNEEETDLKAIYGIFARK